MVDVVSPSNLQRQVLFGVSDVGEDKVKVAARKLKDLNPDVRVIEHKVVVSSDNRVRDGAACRGANTVSSAQLLDLL